jgi:hypothetical protein
LQTIIDEDMKEDLKVERRWEKEHLIDALQ